MIGTVLTVYSPPVTHEGIYVGTDVRGVPWIVSASGQVGAVVLEDLEHFTGAGKSAVGSRGYYGRLHPEEVCRRALGQVGAPYDMAYGNCEQFTRWCHGMRPASPQLRAAVASGALIACGLSAGVYRIFF